MAKKRSTKKSNTQSNTQSKKGIQIKNVILSIAIAIIFSLFIGVGISTFYEGPEYGDYCQDRTSPKFINNSVDCETTGGEWETYDQPLQGGETGYCDLYSKCYDAYSEVSESYDRNVFIITLIIGLITIFVAIVMALPSVSSGLMAGGVLVIIYGVLRYWQHSTDVLKFILLGVTLAILIWLGYKKLNK